MPPNNEIEFNLNELYREGFGYVAPPFPATFFPKKEGDLVAGSFPELRGMSPDVEKLRGNFNWATMLGTELRMPCKIGIPGQEPYQLPNEPIISIDMSFETKITKVNRGGNKKRGTVKEISNLDDYKISIKGIIYQYNENDYPEEDVRRIREILENGLITIECFFTSIFNVSLATVQTCRFNRNESSSFRSQDYDISLLSDEDFELELL